MAWLVEASVKGSVVVLAAFVALRLLRSRSAALRHCVLVASLAAAVLMPLLERALPPLRVGFVPAVAPMREETPTPRAALVFAPAAEGAHTLGVGTPERDPAPPASRLVSVPLASTMVAGIWLGGVVLSLLVLAAGFLRLRWLTAGARRVRDGQWADALARLAAEHGVRRRVTLIESVHPSLLVTWGWWRPRIALPAGSAAWPAERIHIVLAHELEHIRRGDWVVQLGAEVVKALCWFNPLAWITCRRLRLEAERACDDAVLARGVAPAEYAWQLLQLARAFQHPPRAWFPAPAIARRSTLEQRIGAMLDSRINRQPVTRRALLHALLLPILLAAPIAAAQTGGGSFSGTVFDPGGAPAAGARVVLSRGVGAPAYEQIADSDGRFTFTGVPAATYRLDVWGGDDTGRSRVRMAERTWSLLGESVTVRAGGQVVRDITLPLGTIVITQGVTVDRAGVQVLPRDVGFPPTWQCMSGLMFNAFCGPPSLLDEFERDFHDDGTLPPNVTMPRLVERSVPDYPAALIGLGIEGDVTLEGRIGTDGLIGDLRLLNASNAAFVDSARAVAQQMRWEPARIQDVPTEVPIQLEVTFRIQQ